MSKYKHVVTSEEEGLTIKQILKRNYHFSSRFYTKIKFQELLDLNGELAKGYWKPLPGDLIEVRLPEEKSDFEPEDIPITPVYEDEDLLIINKQPGITVHPTKGHPFHTVANGVTKYMEDTEQSFKVRFANRIDMDTSGIVIIAKNANAQNHISSQMRSRHVDKRYLAIVCGNIDEDHFLIDAPIGRPYEGAIQREVLAEGGKDAKTEFTVLERFGDYTLVEAKLHTGRTHQIRVHLTHIGHPIAGDHLYGGDAPGLIDRQALHAAHIGFLHPVSEEMLEVDAPLAEDMEHALALLRSEEGHHASAKTFL